MRNCLWAFATLFYFSFSEINAQNPLSIPDTMSGSVINLLLQKGSVNFKPGPATATMGANGNLLGPTLILHQKQPVTINVTNQLGEPTTIHWHGMHVAPENDGGPHIVIPDGTTWSPSFTVLDQASTHWYHPHMHHHTNEHILKGIAGFIITRDSAESALDLPRRYGVDDFPLVVQTKAFDAANQIVVLSSLDSNLMVNGTINPYLDVPAQVVRFRMLNGSSERYYNFGFMGNRTFYQIAGDAGLLDAPVPLTRLMLAPGERAEILIDLAALSGQNLDLMSFGSELPNAIYGAAQPGMNAMQTIPGYTSNPLNGNNFKVMQLRVGSPTPQPVTTIPASLIANTPWTANQADFTRTFLLTRAGGGGGGSGNVLQGPFLINGASFNMMVINFELNRGRTEIWQITNQTPISHPFHLHAFPFYILDINGVPPPANLRGKKDVVHVPAGMGVVRFITRFEDFSHDSLPYMYHCHMLTHEDDGMMGQFLVRDPCTLTITAEPQNVNATAGDVVQFSVQPNEPTASYQWQTDMGFGFQNISNAGQYSGATTQTLTVSNVSTLNNNQLFRCIVSLNACTDTSTVASLSVIISSVITFAEQESYVRIHTNPFSNQLGVTSTHSAVLNYRITDNTGRAVKSGLIVPGTMFINTEELAAGVYYFQETASGKVYKILKQ